MIRTQKADVPVVQPRENGTKHPLGGTTYVHKITFDTGDAYLHVWLSPGGRWRYIFTPTEPPPADRQPRRWFVLTRDEIAKNTSLQRAAIFLLQLMLDE